MSTAAARQRYLGDAVTTASPAKLITMLYDRLVLDLEQAEAALRLADVGTAGPLLGHAQEIVLELRAALKPEAWSGGPALASLYGFVVAELLAAQVAKDADRVAGCRRLVEPLADAWHQAASMVQAPTAATA